MQVEKANKRERDIQANIRNYSYVYPDFFSIDCAYFVFLVHEF